MAFRVPNRYRVRTGLFGSDPSYGNNGAFFVPNDRDRKGPPLKVIASDGAGWEHVSVSLPTRCPTWEEMASIKARFWEPADCVVQFHPPESDYVNNAPYCLHLWRSTEHAFPVPPSLLVGYKNLKPDDLAGISERGAVLLMTSAADTVLNA